MNSLQVSGNSSTFHVTIEKSPEQRRGADLMSDGSSFFMHKIQWGCSHNQFFRATLSNTMSVRA